jgi:hypothetical protein
MIIKLAAHSSHSASWRRLSLVTGVLADLGRSCSLFTEETVTDNLLTDNLFRIQFGSAWPGSDGRLPGPPH